MIVIIGVLSGIGFVIVWMVVEKGVKVVVVVWNEDVLKEFVDELKEKGYDVIWVKVDVGKEEDVNCIVEIVISIFGCFDIWVNNVVVLIFGYVMDVIVEDMKCMFDVNFWGFVYGIRVVVKYYISRGVSGVFINVGSLFGDRGMVI